MGRKLNCLLHHSNLFPSSSQDFSEPRLYEKAMQGMRDSLGDKHLAPWTVKGIERVLNSEVTKIQRPTISKSIHATFGQLESRYSI